jgi:hypothetical protein
MVLMVGNKTIAQDLAKRSGASSAQGDKWRAPSAYTKFLEAKAWLQNTEAWRTIRAISKATRQYLTEMKKSAAMAFRQS